MTDDDDHARLLRGLLAAHTDLDALPHAGPTGRVMLATAVAGPGCSDDTVALNASMPVAAVREILPSMLERCQHVHVLAQEGTHGFELLNKPYSIEQLSRTLRRAIRK